MVGGVELVGGLTWLVGWIGSKLDWLAWWADPIGWLIGLGWVGFIGWLVSWLVGFIGWLVRFASLRFGSVWFGLVYWLDFGLVVDWLVGWLVGWLIGWLVG